MNWSPRLGILGGMGPQATLSFYQRVVDLTPAARDQEHLDTRILCDTGMPDRTAAILSGETEPVLRRLIRDARELEDCGCTLLAMPCNTAHFFVPELRQAVGVPIVHMIEETVAALTDGGKARPGILATEGTIQTGLYQKACHRAGLTPLVPDEEGQRAAMSLIYDEIKAGKPGSKALFDAAQAPLLAQGCDCVILACTELSVYRDQAGLDGFYVDPMEIMARRALEICGISPRR